MNQPFPGRLLPVLLSLGLLALLAACAPPADSPVESAPAAPTADAAQANVTVPPVTHTLGAENSHNRFSRTIPPVLTVPSGAVVEVHTKEATDGQFNPDSNAEAVVNVDFDPIHPLTGPIAIEGAEPGDVLKVTLHEIEVGDWGWAAIVPGFGWLADEFTEPYLKTFKFEKGATEARFSDNISIPLAPFPGAMGVAPDTDEMLSTIPPRKNGGNMDNKYMTAGTTVYFPVLVEGANFSIGDAHAAQGDGEISGTAIEAPMRFILSLEILKNFRDIPEPQYETNEYYGVTGFGETIDGATKKATRYMIDYLVAEHGLERNDAYVLASLAGDLKISEVVDVPHMLVSMHMPKSIFR